MRFFTYKSKLIKVSNNSNNFNNLEEKIYYFRNSVGSVKELQCFLFLRQNLVWITVPSHTIPFSFCNPNHAFLSF